MSRSELAKETKRPATRWGAERCANSRGGTRTRDPGIMSAVL